MERGALAPGKAGITKQQRCKRGRCVQSTGQSTGKEGWCIGHSFSVL